jgi:prolyl-tRNA editing enzyme YbaK/EbsC (Cys-tRNA(Pro) deacylase)
VNEEAPALADIRLALVPYKLVTHKPVQSLEEAARIRGVKPSSVIKTMVVRRRADDFFFVLVPGDRMIAWPKLRELLEWPRLSLAVAEEALAVTGYPSGSITPFASEHDWPVIADSRIGPGPVSIGAGAPGMSLTIDTGQLLEILDARVADVTRGVHESEL